MNRSSCASGSGYVPSCSIGFCVAITMNGVPSGWVSVSTVTCRSSMHSRSADCVLGLARLISSPSTMLAKMAPGLNSKSPRSWLKTFTPVTSVGSRSGVNWIRRNEQSIDRAMALASMVLPTPGTSSIRRCPSATRATRARRISLCLPRTTRSTFVSISWNRAANRCQSCCCRTSNAYLQVFWQVLVDGAWRDPLAVRGGQHLTAAPSLRLRTMVSAGSTDGNGGKFPESAEPHPVADDEESRQVPGRG